MSDQHLIGTEGDDFLQAAEGNDWLEGLGGNDFLLGGSGDDLYMPGAGVDYISDYDGFDELRFGAGISPDQVERIRQSGSYDLILRVAGTGDQITIGGWFYDPANQIERVAFDDGTVWDAAETSALRYLGSTGDDFIQGTEFDERLEGRGGNDVLLGGAGNDVYLPGFGGTDWINDFAGDDTLHLNGVSPDQIERVRQSGSNDLVLRVAATGDQITLGGWFYDPAFQIERVVFDDGTVWDAAETSSLRRFGTVGDDFIQGEEYDERLEGRGGSDVLLGGAGNDVYLPGFGGSDWVNDFAGDDELRLDGVSPDQIERVRQSGSNDLVLRVAATGDQITLGGWFYDPAFQIERVVFDDGMVWSAVDSSQLRRFGTAGDDFIQGEEYDERLEGRGGNDVLLGGAGNDVYLPGCGGSDWINDFAGEDELRLDGVSPDQIERIRQSGSTDLILRAAGSGDQLTLGGWFYDPAFQIERVVFDDATLWNAAEAGSLRRLGTAGDDFIQGTEYDERLEGRGGSDVLLGGAGNDVYVPGVGGSDWINDFAGDDELRLNGVSPDQIERIRPANSYDLVLRVAGTADQVTLGGWFYDPANQIERVVFDDGTVWDPATTSTLGVGSNETPFVANPIADQSATENSGFSFEVPAGTFADPDAGDVLTLSARLAGGAPLPAWLSFDPATATFSGTPPFGTAGSLSVEVVATDGGALSVSDQFDIAIAAGTNEIYGTEGNDLISGSPGNDLIWAGGGDDEVWGLEGHDAIYADFTATPGNDTVYGGGGGDFIYGGGGTDLLVGGTGDDSYEFISGSTQVVEYAGEGHDQIGVQDSYALPENVEDLRLFGAAVYGTGNDLANLILGTQGDNVIDGRGGADNMQAFGGNDTYVVDHAGDLVFESTAAGTDSVESSITYTLGANVENLVLTGAAAINGTGNTLNNVLTGNSAANVLTGRTGDDTYVVDASDTVVELFNEGTDTVVTSSSYTLGANLENLTLAGAAAIDGTGNASINVIRGNSAANTLRGEFGNDTLYGYEGNDVLDGGVGHDTMVGGAGDDTYYFDFGSDMAIEAAGEGIDTVFSSIGIDLDDNVENLVVIADVGAFGGGNALDNIITGGAGGDFLVGYAGNDTLYGGAGYDWLRGYEGDDSLYGQADLDDLFGFTGNDYLDGGEANDVLDGGAGADTMVGGVGDDLYRVDDSGDVVVEAAGEGVDSVESALAGYMLPDGVENLTLVGEAGSGTGNEAANVIIGNDLANSIGGRGGDDILIGGGGNDYLVDFGDGNDQLIGGAGSDFMIGVEGNDVYDPGFGGQDTVYDTGGDDEVRLGSTPPGEVERIREGDHLILRAAGTTESVTLYNWFSDPAWQIERVVFDDGTVWDAATSASLRYLGTAGDDVLQGSWYDELLEGRDGNDQIAGGYGSDALVGGRGSDTYLFEWLSGDVDTVRESQADLFDVDTLRFVIWITPEDLIVTQDGLDLQVAIAGQSAAVRFEGWFDPAISSHVERFEFQDGTVLSDGVIESMINDAPVLTNPIADQSAQDEVAFSFTAPAEAFSDSDPYDVLSYSATLADGSALPTWLTFDLATRTFAGTPAPADAGTLAIRVTATDRQGLGASDEFNLTVTYDGTITGTEADDDISGTSSDDTIFGLGGGDILRGGAGDDTLNGGAGADQLYGGSGNDSYFITPGDLVVEIDGEGVDTVYSIASYTLAPGSSVENLTLIAGALNASGNELANVIVGNDGDNRLDGGAGAAADTLSGGAGNDTYIVKSSDTVIEAAGQGIDTVETGGTYALGENLENLTLTGDAAVHGFGNSLDNVITGNTASNQLNGNAGNDTLNGAAGDDSLFGMRGSDTYVFSRGTGADYAWELEAGNPGDIDVVAVAADIAPAQIAVRYEPSHQTAFNDGGFVLTVTGTADRFKIVWSPVTGPEFEVEEVRFADGTVWDETVLATMAIQNGVAPTLVSALADQGATEDALFSYTVPANAFDDVDIAIGDSLSYSASLADGSALPSWLSFDSASRAFSGAPANADVGTISVRVTATDESGRSASDVFALSVANTNDAPTLDNPIADQNATEDSAFSFTLATNAFADIDVGDFLDYAAVLADGSALPTWLVFDPGTRTFSGTPANADVGTIAVRITATDGAGASASDVFGIAVSNTNDAPTVASPIADQSAQDTVAFSFNVPAGAFADVDAGDSLTYSTGTLPSWLSFNAATRTFSGTPGSGDLGVVSIVVTATDGAGAQASDAFNISVGAAPDQTITGTAGNDTLNGASGNDTINGLAGADAMAGGLGDDAYFVDNAGDQVTEAAGAGNDTVNSSIGYTLGANVENLVLTGSGNINGTGNGLDNWLTGNNGKNTLAGGAGDDTYVITQSGDSVSENAGSGVDTVRASITYSLGNNVENLVLTGTSSINGTGNNADNWLTGNDGSNTLRGQGGADSLSGGAGNDILTGGAGLDTFWFLEAPGSADADHITDFGSGERLLLEDLVHPGIGAAGNFAPNDARFFAAPGASGGADASDRVIYDTTSGRLYFDADGGGAAAPSLIAILDNVFALSASNITVI